MPNSAPGRPLPPDEPPPFLGTWKRVYLAVLCYLAGFIGLLALFTWSFRQ